MIFKPDSQRPPHSNSPQSHTAGFYAAVEHLQAGRLSEAQALLIDVLSANPRHYQSLYHLGLIEHQLGHNERALEFIRKSLAIQPDYSEALCDLGLLLAKTGHDGEAIHACTQAIAANPDYATAYGVLGNILLRKGQLADARTAYARAVALDPDYAAAYASLADTLAAEGRLEEALLACDRAIQLAPHMAIAHGVRGSILHRRGRYSEAANAYVNALEINPNFAVFHMRLANTLSAAGLFEEALTFSGQAVQLDPTCAEAYTSLAHTLQALGRYHEALGACRKAVIIKPDYVEAHVNLGILLHRLGQCEEAIVAFQAAVSIDPGCQSALTNLASLYKELGRTQEVVATYRQMLAGQGLRQAACLYDYCDLRRHICDWDGLEADEASAVEAVSRSGERVPPFASLAMPAAPADQLAVARSWARGFAAKPSHSAQASQTAVAPDGRIRVGYLSSDFNNRPAASRLVEFIEHHDRDRFEVFAYCWSHDDGSEMRARLTGAFDNFADIRQFSHAEAARRIQEDGVDILVDLKGYTPDARTQILAKRPATIQVSFLGYPGTMGARFIDYIIADPFVLPMTHQPFYDEKIVHLPDCYQSCDTKRKIVSQPERSACGLPENGFVFCYFGDLSKVTSQIFAVWMRLLRNISHSVLWLPDRGGPAIANLEREAARQGIDPARLVFAPMLPSDENLSRCQLADLFLDTWPFNASTVTGEALWCGLPVLTCAGGTFASRVTGSLLNAAGLTELVTISPAAYEAMALRLAHDRNLLASLRDKLAWSRSAAPLFATERYARNIEAAFAHMMWLHARGRPPEPFAVADLPHLGGDIRHSANS